MDLYEVFSIVRYANQLFQKTDLMKSGGIIYLPKPPLTPNRGVDKLNTRPGHSDTMSSFMH
jgi:hypothetical protein